jgi:hypothetical protein
MMGSQSSPSPGVLEGMPDRREGTGHGEEIFVLIQTTLDGLSLKIVNNS